MLVFEGLDIVFLNE